MRYKYFLFPAGIFDSKRPEVKHFAFTLSEVLITLGIIGVIAAMTIPTLVANYQNKTWSTSASVFERKLEEALKTMNTQQSLAGYKNTADFVAELGKHFKINKVCQNSDIKSCFNENITWEIIDISSGSKSEKIVMPEIKTAADLGQDDWDSEALGVQFANGTTGIIAYNPDCREQPFTNQFTGTSCVSLVYDTNGFKSPNSFNKDVRGINSFLKSCAFRSGSTCFSAPVTTSYDSITTSECEKIKSELGISMCPDYQDWWGAAVKSCGGVNKMANISHFDDIRNFVYDESTDGTITFNAEKAAKLGFTPDNYGEITFWVGEENPPYEAYTYYFYPHESSWSSSSSRYAGPMAYICLGE